MPGPRYLLHYLQTRAGGPDAFTENWTQWRHIYLFPPPLTMIMLKVVRRFESYQGQVFVAPKWEAQPWARTQLGDQALTTDREWEFVRSSSLRT